MVRIACLVSLLFAGTANASGFQAPPAKYDYAPTVRVQVLEGTHSEIQRVCRLASRYSGLGTIHACAIPGKVCIIVWPKGKPRSGALWRHERAHCNGWRH